MTQLAHTDEMPVARAGMTADNSYMSDTVSRSLEDAGGIYAGTYLAQSATGEAYAKAPTTAAEVTKGLGVARWDTVKEPLSTGLDYAQTETLPIQTRGRIWVLLDAGSTVTPASDVYVRRAAGAGGSVLGTFREDADTDTATQLTNAKYRSNNTSVTILGVTQNIALVDLG